MTRGRARRQACLPTDAFRALDLSAETNEGMFEDAEGS